MLLKLHGSQLFADEVPRIEKGGSGQSTKVKREVLPIASTSHPVPHKVTVITPSIESDATGVPEIHSYLRFTVDGSFVYLRTGI